MAGIGFRLQKLLVGESYTDLLKAYAYSSMIAAGPMLVVMLSLGLVKYVARSYLGLDGEAQFMGLVVYVYAWSMVIVSPFFFVVTRYLADCYYLKNYDRFSPIYFSSLAVVFFVQAVVGFWFLAKLGLPRRIVAWEMVLFLSVGGIWLAMVILSAARSYFWITAAFVLGGILSIVAAIFLGRHHGLAGFLGGFAMGQVLTFAILSFRIIREFGCRMAYDFMFLNYMVRYPMLLAVGVLYYVGIWVDKFVFWASSESTTVLKHIHIMPGYDTPLFAAYLTVVPSLAFFLIQMETTFAATYQAYYESVRRRSSLGVVRACEKNVADALSIQFQRFAVFQGVISGVAILIAPQIGSLFGLSPAQVGVFRISMLGAFMQMGVIMMINVLFYFDAQKSVALLTLIFAVLNGYLAHVTIRLGMATYGFGYTLTSFVTLVCGFIILDQRLRWLNYWTFMRQPIVIPKFKLESEWKKSKA